MLSTALIVFREVLESALVISILMAATRGASGRTHWIACGVSGGLAGAALLAAFADSLGQLAAGMGQEVFNAAIMLVAVAMLVWHGVWMSRHGREMAREYGALGIAVSEGRTTLAGLAMVVGISVLREGAEAMLFLYGIAAGSPGQLPDMLAGAGIGVAGGVGLGYAMYAGLLRVPLQRLFTTTNVLVALLAAGMASQCAGFLIAADWLPSWGDAIWDSSWLLDETSVPGKMLHALVGYTARPAGIQLVCYAATLASIALASKTVARSAPPR